MNNSYIIDLAGVADRTELHDRVGMEEIWMRCMTS